ncbi:MAG: TetR/AcrR family transcriptional regulator [Myxococcota bacterium]|jgi:AcrR family transcriptional regulator|nr:TetR/AcrR family transcriptional regulator [Myxococcota bacterium]
MAPLVAAATTDRGARGEKRQQILEAATRVFASRGYHGARVSDIAREAGIAYGLVYHYFRNKDEILDTIFAERWGAFVDVVDEVAAGSQPASEKLRQLAALVLFAYRRRPDWVKVLVFEIQRSSRFSEPEQIEAVGRLFRAVARIVRDGQEAGELRGDLDANLVCLAFIGALETMITSQVLGVMRLPESSQSADDRTVGDVVELFLGGLAVRGRS